MSPQGVSVVDRATTLPPVSTRAYLLNFLGVVLCRSQWHHITERPHVPEEVLESPAIPVWPRHPPLLVALAAACSCAVWGAPRLTMSHMLAVVLPDTV